MKIEKVKNPKQGTEIAKNILYKTVDSKTALFLSGGSTPKPLYKLLAEEKKLRVGAVAMVDERHGIPLHKDSNERMIREAGLIDYLETQHIPFYRILQKISRHSGKRSSALQNGAHPESPTVQRDSGVLSASWRIVPRMTLEKATDDYDKKVDYLLSSFPKRIAIMGIGEDGHTASLRAGSQKSILRQSSGQEVKSQKYVVGIRDFPGEFKERITLTFNALSKMDLLIVLVFGEKKKSALIKMFEEGSIEEVPARFFNLAGITKKTIVITDQKV